MELAPDDLPDGFGLFDGEVVGGHTLTVAAAPGAAMDVFNGLDEG